jgi:hypothetical protein
MELRELADIGGVSGLLVSTRSIYKQHLQTVCESHGFAEKADGS